MDSKPPLGCAPLLRRVLVDRYWGSASSGGPSWHKGIWCCSSVVPDRGENQYITLQKHGISSRLQHRNHRVISTLTRSTWPNSPTASEQITWKSLKVEDERTAQSLSDLPRRKKKTKWDHIMFMYYIILQVKIKTILVIFASWWSSLDFGFMALVHLMTAVKHKPINDVFEGPET